MEGRLPVVSGGETLHRVVPLVRRQAGRRLTGAKGWLIPGCLESGCNHVLLVTPRWMATRKSLAWSSPRRDLRGQSSDIPWDMAAFSCQPFPPPL